MFQIDQKSRKSIYQQVVDNIKELIIRGILEPDTKLPSVRELSKQLTINPNTVSKAYKELEHHGYIYTSSGLGTFVSELKDQPIDQEKYEAICGHLRFYIKELYFMGLTEDEVRKTIEELISKRGENND